MSGCSISSTSCYNFLFLFSVGTTTYLSKICKREDLAPSLAMGVSLSHLTAIVVPVFGAALWNNSATNFPFLFGTVFVVALAHRHAEDRCRQPAILDCHGIAKRRDIDWADHPAFPRGPAERSLVKAISVVSIDGGRRVLIDDREYALIGRVGELLTRPLNNRSAQVHRCRCSGRDTCRARLDCWKARCCRASFRHRPCVDRSMAVTRPLLRLVPVPPDYGRQPGVDADARAPAVERGGPSRTTGDP